MKEKKKSNKMQVTGSLAWYTNSKIKLASTYLSVVYE